MTHALKTALFAAASLAASAAAQAQTPSSFGHWEGVLNSQLGSAPLQIDIGADAAGKPIAVLTLPGEGIAGLPLRDVRLEGANVAFALPTSGEGSFAAALSADGKSLTGTLDKGFGVADFQLERAGEPRFPAEPRNAPVSAALAGDWVGALDPDGRNIPIRISLVNQGAASIGRAVVDDAVAFPLAVHESGDAIRLDIVSAGEAFALTLDRQADALVGSYLSNGGGRSAVTLKRAKS